jgi:hypothetical protein
MGQLTRDNINFLKVEICSGRIDPHPNSQTRFHSQMPTIQQLTPINEIEPVHKFHANFEIYAPPKKK